MENEKYNELKKKYKLPELKDVLEKFELILKPDGLVLQTIRNEIGEKLYGLAKTIEAIIFTGEGSEPDIMYTESMISNLSKDCFELYKKLNQLHFRVLKLKFTKGPEKDAEFIRFIFNEWDSIEEKARQVFEQIEKGWENLKPNRLKEDDYHG